MIRPASSGRAYFVVAKEGQFFLVYSSRAMEPGDEITFEPTRDGLGRPRWVVGLRNRNLLVGVAP